jgi:hypothetical protein
LPNPHKINVSQFLLYFCAVAFFLLYDTNLLNISEL